MKILKNHPFLFLYIALLIAALILKVPALYILLGSLVFLIAVYLIRLPNALMWTGYILQTTFHQPEAAFKLYEKALRMGANAPSPTLVYCVRLMEARRYEEARTHMENLLMNPRLRPTVLKILRQDLAICYWQCKDTELAISTMEKMKEDYDFFDPDFYVNLGYYYIDAGDYEKAKEASEEALKLSPGFGPAYDNLGVMAYRQGNLEEAQHNLERALELRGTMASSKYYLGLVHEAKGELDTAKAYFAAAHKLKITGLNTVTREQVDEKYDTYF